MDLKHEMKMVKLTEYYELDTRSNQVLKNMSTSCWIHAHMLTKYCSGCSGVRGRRRVIIKPNLHMFNETLIFCVNGTPAESAVGFSSPWLR